MNFTYECGDIYEDEHLGRTFYCIEDRGHKGGRHLGHTAGEEDIPLAWTDDDPRRRANKDSASRAIAGGAPAPPSG